MSARNTSATSKARRKDQRWFAGWCRGMEGAVPTGLRDPIEQEGCVAFYANVPHGAGGEYWSVTHTMALNPYREARKP